MPRGKQTRVDLDADFFQKRATQMLDDPLDIQGLPNVLILEAVLRYHPDVKMPEYNIYEISRIFFGREKRYVINILTSEGKQKLAQHRMSIPVWGKGVTWTLAEVELMVHILHDLKRISYARMVIALHIVAWTAKAHDLYV